MKKTVTYIRYLFDYLMNGNFGLIIPSVKYVINKSSHSKDRITKTKIGVFFCRKNTNDFQFANYYYEWGVRKYVLNQKNKFTVFIDGGAGVGDYSILLSKFNIRCIAFEPMLNNFKVLQKNLELNDIKSKVEALPLGLGDKNFLAQFIFNPVNTGASHISEKPIIEDSIVCQADIRTFDSLLSSLKIEKTEKILFKLDLEGMELEAILGSYNFISSYPYLTFLIETKHSGEALVKEALTKIASFQFGKVDEFNIFATKN